ncbi:MAG: tetratricopeptide repeat protein [Candidatus Promineifilaceae bacterium]
MPQYPDKFAQLLTEAIYRIRVKESKTIGAVQDELGYAIGKHGGASIEYWRKGNIPSKREDVERLAEEIVRRSDLNTSWLNDFLVSSGHPDPPYLINQIAKPVQSWQAPTANPVQILPSSSSNLPIQPTPFIGREEELEIISGRLQDPSCRLLTLVGPGGIGKTRLALQAAKMEMASFEHGVYFVPLLSLSSNEFLVSTVADSVGLSFYKGESPQAQLLSFLQSKRILLVIDNFEHLIQEVGLLAEILKTAPQVKMIVTSRERLNLRGEWVFQVRGMPVPTPKVGSTNDSLNLGDAESYSSIQLFIESARRVYSDIVLTETDQPYIIRICQLVEGIPLGIELAAAWVKMLTCEEIAREIEQNYEFLATSLRDMPERHRSLQAVFDYSWEMLSEQERQAMGRLSVFQGGFRRDAAVQVTGTSLMILSALVDKSFLQRNSPANGSHISESEVRYEMHDMLRQYSAEKLAEQTGGIHDGEFISLVQEQTRAKHSSYYANFLFQRKDRLRGAKQRETLEEIGEEIENIRAAWQWAVKHQADQIIGKCLVALFYFYDIRGWVQEGMEAFREAVNTLWEIREATPAKVDPHVFAQAVVRCGRLYHLLGQYDRAQALIEEGVALFREHDDRQGVAIGLNYLGKIDYRLGDYIESINYCQESLIICREIDYRWGMMSALETLGAASEGIGEYNEAKRCFQEGLQICRQIDDRRSAATLLNGLGQVEWRLGELDEANKLCQESLEIYRVLGDRRGMSLTLKNLGNVSSNIYHYELAEQQYKQGLALAHEIGYQWGVAALLNNLGNLFWEQGRYEEAEDYCQQSLDSWRQLGDQWGIGGSLETLGSSALNKEEWAEAEACFKAALEIGADIQSPPLSLGVLIGMSKLLSVGGNTQLALETLSLVIHHRAIDKESAVRAAQLFDEIANGCDVPQSAVISAREKGKTLILDEVVRQMLN